MAFDKANILVILFEAKQKKNKKENKIKKEWVYYDSIFECYAVFVFVERI